VRDRIEVAPEISDGDAERLALGSPRIIEALAGVEPRRVVVRAPKLVNIVP
jgi:leucyl-tRNA synthetase